MRIAERKFATLGLTVLVLLAGCSGLGIGEPSGGDGMVEITVVAKDSEIDGATPYEGSALSRIESVNSSVKTLVRNLDRTGDNTTSSSVELSPEEVQVVKDELAEVENKNPVEKWYPRGEYYSTDEYYIVVELFIYS